MYCGARQDGFAKFIAIKWQKCDFLTYGGHAESVFAMAHPMCKAK